MDDLKIFVHQIIKCLGLCLIVSLVANCHTVHPTTPTSYQQIQSEMNNDIQTDKKLDKRSKPHVPYAVNSALMPSMNNYIRPAKEKEPRFDVAANKVPAKEFYMGLIKDTNYNLVLDPKISGTISLSLKNVTVRQAMEAVKDIYGYEYRKTSYGYEIMPPHLQTQLFHINYLDVKRTGKSYTQLNAGDVTSTGTINVGGNNSNLYNPAPTSTPSAAEGTGTISSIETKSEMEFWKHIEKAISSIIGDKDGRSVTVSAQAGVIAVRAFPGELRSIAHYVNSLQSSLNRQVILEAKILEVRLNDNYQAGIDWSILSNPAAIDPKTGLPNTGAGIGQDGTKIFDRTDLRDLKGGIFAIRVNGNFKLLVNLLQTQGNVQVLSSPHISTVNNQKAVIKVGQSEFFVTGVSTSNTVVGTNTLPSQDVSLTPFFSGVTLDVTPEISSDDTVSLHIHPSISRVTSQTKIVGLGTNATGSANNLTLPLAVSTIRESDNIVRAKSGQVIIIGGLMENRMEETVAGVPYLSKLPFVGAAFRRTDQQAVKAEFIILLKPVVAKNKSFINKLEKSEKSFTILRRPFHEGGLSKVFGNEAERASYF